MGYYHDLTNQRFGSLVVLGFAENRKGKSFWNCQCQCGNNRIVQGNSLTSGNTKSCGCQHREFMVKALGGRMGKLTATYWYRVEANAKMREIPVHVTQKEVAVLFDKQDGKCALTGVQLILDAPIEQITASLDRIDSSRGYVTGNVQWVHKKVNKMKNDMDSSEFLEWANRISEHSK